MVKTSKNCGGHWRSCTNRANLVARVFCHAHFSVEPSFFFFNIHMHAVLKTSLEFYVEYIHRCRIPNSETILTRVLSHSKKITSA